MTGCQHKSNEKVHSPLKTMFERTGDRYQSYCTKYKTHAMTNCHGGAECPEDRELNSYIEGARGIDIGPDNDNESEHSSDTTVAFGGAEANGHLSDPLPNSQADLKLLTRQSRRRSRRTRLHRLPEKGITKSLPCFKNTNTFNSSMQGTILRSGMPMHRHTMQHTKADKSHKFPTTGHCHLQ